jgi:hypothetical protein
MRTQVDLQVATTFPKNITGEGRTPQTKNLNQQSSSRESFVGFNRNSVGASGAA